MLALLPCLLAAFAPVQDSPRLRTLLNNGTAILVERMPDARQLNVHLFASARGVEETSGTHGYRHLLEHLMLKGKDNRLDQRLEAKGIFFVGRTLRDVMDIHFTASPTQLPDILAALEEVLAPLKTTPEAIQQELSILRQERTLQDDTMRLSRTAWTAAFQEAGLEPFGNLDTMAKVSPDELVGLQLLHFTPANLVISVSGPVELESTTKLIQTKFEEREGPGVAARHPVVPQAARAEAEDAFGEMRGALSNGLGRTTAANLCAAYAISARLENTTVLYTPTLGPGMVLVGRTDANNRLGQFIDGLTPGEQAALFPIGKLLADRWLSTLLKTPQGNSYLRGFLIALSPALKPEELLDNIRTVTWTEFSEAIARFRKEKAVIAVGVHS